MDNAIALGIKPLQIDVATPLMTAAKIRQSQQEEQQTRMTMQRDALNATARGLAPLAGTPEFGQRVQEAGMQLRQQGILDDAGVQRFTSAVSSPLTLQSILAQTTDPALAQRQTEATQRAKEHAQSFGLQTQQFGLSQQQFAETQKVHAATLMQPVKIGVGFGGEEVYAVRDPDSGTFRKIDIKTGQLGPVVPPGAVPAGGPQPGAPAPAVSPGAPEPVGGVPGAVPPAPAAGAVKKPPPSATDIAGQKYLDENIPKEHHKTVEGLANYEINPTTFSTKGGHRERLIDAASNLAAARGESYDQKEYGSRTAAVKAFATGTQGNAVRSFDVAIDHLHTLSELAKAMENGDVKLINMVRNKFKDQFGYDAPSNFDAAKSIVSAEITKAVVGGNSALADREELRTPLNNAKSPGQLSGVIDKVYKPLMAGQLLGLKKQYEDTTGRKNFETRLRERTRQELGVGAPAAGGASGAGDVPALPDVVRQNGHTYQKQPDGSYKAID